MTQSLNYNVHATSTYCIINRVATLPDLSVEIF